MKTLIAAPLIALAFAVPAPLVLAQGDIALPATSGYSVTREQALDIARAEGMTQLREIERDDGKWEIEGCTADRMEIELDIHGRTGDILKLEIERDDDDDC